MTALASKMAHSLLTRLALILLTLGGLIAAVLLVSWLVFQTIEESMSALKSEKLPKLRANSAVIKSTNATRALLMSTLIAEDREALKEQTKVANQIFADFRHALDLLSADESAVMRPTLDQTDAAFTKLLNARSLEFATTASMAETILSASADAETASNLIEEANDSAFFDMSLSGDETITVIDETLSRLVDENFNQFQTALSIRGEINLIAGLAIAYSQDSQSQISSIMADLAKSAMDRLKASLAQNENLPAFETILPVLRESMATFDSIFQNERRAPSTSDILAARLAVDTALSPTLDDIYFDLIIANDDAKETNRASLQKLLEIDVESMRLNASLDTATKFFFAVLLQVASAQTKADLEQRQSALEELAEDILRLKAGTAFDTQADLLHLLKLADPDTGISAQRAEMFAAQSEVLAATTEATEAVDAIAAETALFSETVFSKIEEAAAFMAGNVDNAKAQLVTIATVAIAVMLIVPVFLWYYVTQPISRVTLVTERLANGDLSEVQGLPRNQGELGRMATALHVFRDNALKNIAMQEDERKREHAAAEAERAAEKKKLEEERRRAAEIAEQKEAERALEDQLAAEEKKRQDKDNAERAARMEEQAFIVSTLAQGLNNLAAGDLTCMINSTFPEGYEALRLDFNAAIKNLSEIVHQLKGSSETIEGSCTEIASASDDLARRTESSAATLAETVASIGNLSSSVAEAADNAGEANATIQSVRDQAKLNNEVMRKAQSAMGRIEEASGKITSIVGIIDAIAFQTNLLALNAGVEAARAGEAGQGFAVVANEVRTLAQRCSEAASDIGAVVQESTNSVQEGVELTEKANEAMSMINEGIDQISQIVEGMADASAHQAKGLGDVNLAIQNLDRSTQQNAAMFEETSASNQTLSFEASALSKVVRSFAIDTDVETGPPESLAS